jgi:hypothetical protein
MSSIDLNNVKFQLDMITIFINGMTLNQLNDKIKEKVPEIKDEMIR